ncbi:hypothetical protein PISMIDRAFT_19588 [Pisolithus microcarpus 441]|uniref:Uncharacterized protein n=1 Tax=Pisolithus microcarpus 441 TaxID=765257 RepID=A0A0C9Y2G7_9AGAM|nr:hypothetical protein PISMIDRAFT_19588 [Pisolithus microcarpus 441]
MSAGRLDLRWSEKHQDGSLNTRLMARSKHALISRPEAPWVPQSRQYCSVETALAAVVQVRDLDAGQSHLIVSRSDYHADMIFADSRWPLTDY